MLPSFGANLPVGLLTQALQKASVSLEMTIIRACLEPDCPKTGGPCPEHSLRENVGVENLSGRPAEK